MLKFPQNKTFLCQLHGILDKTAFRPSTLSRKRHICRECENHRQNQYLSSSRRTPYQKWRSLVYRAKRKFNNQHLNLDWKTVGQTCMHQLCEQTGISSSELQQYHLAWPKNAKQLDLKHLVLK